MDLLHVHTKFSMKCLARSSYSRREILHNLLNLVLSSKLKSSMHVTKFKLKLKCIGCRTRHSCDGRDARRSYRIYLLYRVA
eukprot:SAG31_NODE_1016_length_10365_cov_16.138418_11_plen_81_part_00